MPIKSDFMKFFLVSALITFAFTNCNNNRLISQVELVQPWDSSKFYNLSIPIENINYFYRIAINITKSPQYNYQNLWVFSKMITPAGKERIDTINFIFDHANLSNNFLNKNTYSYLIADSIKFNAKGIFTIELKQAFRIKELNNIKKIRLIIEKIDN